MKILTLHTVQSAPKASKGLLQHSIDLFGWIPNQSGYMAESPSLLSAYQYAHEAFAECSLTDEEKTIVWLTAGIHSQCEYTIKAHTWIAEKKGISGHLISAVLQHPENLSERFATLQHFTKTVAAAQYGIPANESESFMRAGFTERNMLDVILGVSQKKMSALLNSLAKPQVDRKFVTIT